jgi:hypothetical protein
MPAKKITKKSKPVVKKPASQEPTPLAEIPVQEPVVQETPVADQPSTSLIDIEQTPQETVSPTVDLTPPVSNTIDTELKTTAPQEEVVPTETVTENPEETGSSEATKTEDDIFAEEPQGSGKKLFLIFLIALVFGVLLVGGYFYFMSQKSSGTSEESDKQEQQDGSTAKEKEATDEATMEESSENNEATPAAAFSDYTVHILNGSGISGEAGVVQKLLTTAGFESFETGNADSYDYEETEVSMKEEIPAEVFESISEVLESYTVVEGDLLDEDALYDIVITVGQKSS